MRFTIKHSIFSGHIDRRRVGLFSGSSLIFALALALFTTTTGQPIVDSALAAYCEADMLATNFQLTNSSGAAKTQFALNEAIYVKVTLKNQGVAWARSADDHIYSQIYSHKPTAVTSGTLSDVNMRMNNGEYPNNWIKSYDSYPGGANGSVFDQSKYFKKSVAGNYVARIYINFDGAACESNLGNNQRTLNYTVGSPSPTPTPTPTPSGSYVNLVAEKLLLRDSRGFEHPGNVFAPNENIYPYITIANRGNLASASGSQTHLYPHKASTLAIGTASSPLSYLQHGSFAINTAYNHNPSQLNGAKTFKQAYAGAYYARIFTDYANLIKESNESDNQRTTTYSINNSWPKAVINPTHTLMVVNKKYKLASNYVPSDLVSVGIPYTNNQPMRKEAATALKKMRDVMAGQGVYMRLLSGYRSYWTQDSLYWNYVRQYGQTAADRFSARAGHSEHQSGWTADVGDMQNTYCDFDNSCFQSTKVGKWLINYGHNYGFIVRYPSGKEAVTGYYYEPWHIRYVGVSTATAIRNSGKTVEEYYGITGGGY